MLFGCVHAIKLIVVYVCTITGQQAVILKLVQFHSFEHLLSYVAGSSKIRELAFLLHMIETSKEKNSTITQAEGFYKVCSYMLTHSSISLFEMAKFDGFKIVDSRRAQFYQGAQNRPGCSCLPLYCVPVSGISLVKVGLRIHH